MSTRTVYTLAGAGLLVLAGCASQQKQGEMSPSAQRAQQAQEQSQHQLQAASDAQKKASDQAQKAQEAHQEVARAQQKLEQARQELRQAQQKDRQEQAKAQQLQQQAMAATQQATQNAQQSQQRASQALSTEAQRTARGEHTVAGQVVAAAPSQLVLQAPGGQMTLQLDQNTQIRIDGREAQASEIVQGEQARVAYQMSTSSRPTAVSVDVSSTGQLPPASESQGMGSGGQGQQGSSSSGSQQQGSGSSGSQQPQQ